MVLAVFALTKKAGGFDLKRDVLEGHGAPGKLYPTNTGDGAEGGGYHDVSAADPQRFE